MFCLKNRTTYVDFETVCGLFNDCFYDTDFTIRPSYGFRVPELRRRSGFAIVRCRKRDIRNDDTDPAVRAAVTEVKNNKYVPQRYRSGD